MMAAGAAALQSQAPVNALNVHVAGFHPMKDDPAVQMESHHFCRQVNAEFTQCALFDGSGENANLNGIEYIISSRLYDTLPAEEKQYWHPHNYEVLSGQLVAPGMPDAAERQVMQNMINTYGKTWQAWNSGNSTRPPDKLPLGDAKLAWSFNRDGEAARGLVQQRNQALNINMGEKRQARSALVAQAEPQAGVNVIKDQFPGPTESIAGVRDREEAGPRFSELDRNGDGFLNPSEATAYQNLEQNWQQVDRNRDGVIDRSEFSAFETHPAPPSEQDQPQESQPAQ